MSRPRKINIGTRQEHALRCAEAWWRSKRPLAWSFTQHFGNMTVNCTNEWEKNLAVAVANLIWDRKLRETIPNRHRTSPAPEGGRDE